MGIGKSIKRIDAVQKVTGTAQFVEDLVPSNALHVKIVHSTIANGLVKKINIEKALLMPGVEDIMTCFDVPKTQYPTAGHPLALDSSHADVRDRLILSERVRFYGDEVAAVVADTPLHAIEAAEAVEVEYEDYGPLLTPGAAIGAGSILHVEKPTNELARMDFTIDGNGNTLFYTGTFSESPYIAGREDLKGEHFTVPAVHACHMETNQCFAYMDGDEIIVVTCNQNPFTLRRNIATALEVPVGRIRVVKPYLGGGFGNKQDTMMEPIAAMLTTRVNGRPVYLQLSREECFVNTRTRHGFDMDMYTEIGDDMKIHRKALRINSNGGAYAAHNHAVAAYAITNNFQTYECDGEQIGESSTAYTSISSAGAMRGYGIPQLSFAMESQMDDIARERGWDPVELRLKNIQKPGFVDPFDKFVEEANGLRECVLKAVELSDWYNKRKTYDEYNRNSKDIKKGLGLALFSYKIGVWPLQIENDGCRIIMNEDGTCQVQSGAVELGQGCDTVMAQIISEITTIPENRIRMMSTQDTDLSPYSSGAYASRQTYICGSAAQKSAEALVRKIIACAGYMAERDTDGWSVRDECVVDEKGAVVYTFAHICTFMNFTNDYKTETVHITSEETYTKQAICFVYGVSVVDLDVDVPVGKIKLNKVWAVHESGKIINPQLASAQLDGGVAMGLGYALGEQLQYDRKTGRMLNNNLLDYKIPTTMDIPDIETAFVETYEPTGPLGAKGLAEPPTIPQAPAVRNAVLHATGVGINDLPLNPQRLVHEFKKAGII